MKLSIGAVCLSKGKTYLKVYINHVDDFSSVFFSASSEDGDVLPLETYDVPSGNDSERMRSYVLVTPILNTKAIFLNVTLGNSTDDTFIVKKRLLLRSIIRAASWFNYRFHKVETSQIRDIDRFTYSDQIHINPIYVGLVHETNEYIIKGIVCSPADDCPGLKLLASNGSRIDQFDCYTGRANVVVEDGIKRVELPFTARIARDGSSYCLVASADGTSRSAFFNCTSRLMPFYCDVYALPYYRLAEVKHWGEYQWARSRKYNLATSSDYIINDGPKFSIVVPLYQTPRKFFSEMVESVIDQLYTNWELILVNASPDDAELREEISLHVDPRIRLINLETNLGISDNTNEGILECSGDFVAFLDHDDVLDKMALFRFAKVSYDYPDVDWMYSDEDNLTEDNQYINPHFKSDFNIDLLRCHNYITHFLAVKSVYAKSLLLKSAYDGAQDYDFLLRLSEMTTNVYHVPEVLYHWRMSDSSTAKNPNSKSYAESAGLNALNDHLRRCGLNAIAQKSEVRFLYRTEYGVSSEPMVSILIPNKDSAEVLSRCISSIFEKTSYNNFEIIIIENNSTAKETFEFYDKVTNAYSNVRVVHWKDEFNYSKINNFGVSFSRGDYILLLNNDIEVISSNWLTSMVGYALRPEVGIVGTKLLYPDNTVQHAGVTTPFSKSLNEVSGPFHVFANIDSHDPGYQNRAIFSQDVSMVTGACLLVDRKVYEEVGGLSERYAVAYNDIDFCLKVRKKGYLVVYDANVSLYHYESFSRGSDLAPDKVNRFISEQGKLRADWPEVFSGYDPYYGKYVIW